MKKLFGPEVPYLIFIVFLNKKTLKWSQTRSLSSLRYNEYGLILLRFIECRMLDIYLIHTKSDVKQIIYSLEDIRQFVGVLHEVSRESIWLSNLTQHIRDNGGLTSNRDVPTILYENNVACLAQFKEGFIKRARTKHISPSPFSSMIFRSSVHGISIQKNQSNNIFADFFLLKHFIHHGDFEDAHQMLDEMLERTGAVVSVDREGGSGSGEKEFFGEKSANGRTCAVAGPKITTEKSPECAKEPALLPRNRRDGRRTELCNCRKSQQVRLQRWRGSDCSRKTTQVEQKRDDAGAAIKRDKGIKSNFLVKTWKRCRSFPHSRRNSTDGVGGLAKCRSWSGVEMKKKKMVPEGFFPVCVGPEKQRFAVKTKYASHPLFTMLLEDAEEYGYNRDGPISLSCDVDLFYKVLAEMEAKDVQPLGWSFAYGSCSPFNPSRRLGSKVAEQITKEGYGSYGRLNSSNLIIKMN
ncbi:hypothetical protein LXL04_009350 [Taraxacum kok-saghyz]